MRRKRTVVVLGIIALATLMGCTTPQHSVDIPYPRTTPFDQDSMARMTYLDAFRDGYIAGRGATLGTIESLHRPYPLAYEMGFRAGASAARPPQPSVDTVPSPNR
jgi:hypothetical protein